MEILGARVGSTSGGANPCGMGGEISLYKPRNGDQPEMDFGTYYSEEVVLHILAGDTELAEYVRAMAAIHATLRLAETNAEARHK